LIYGDYCGPVFAEYTTQMVELSSDGPRLRNSLLGAGSAAMAISPDARSFVRAEAAEPMVTGIAVRDSVTGDVLVNLAGMCEWDASAALQEQACPTYPGQPFGLDPSRLRWSPDGSMVAAAEWWGGDFTSFYAVWDAHTGRLLTDGRSAVATQDVIFSPDSDRLISVHEDGNGGLRLESVSTSDWHVAVSAPFNSASDLALIGYTAGSGTLVGVSELLSDQAGTAALHWFDARTLEETRQPTEKIHDGSVKAVAMSPSGNFVASGASDGTVRIWDAASGQLVHEIGTGSAEAQGVAFLDDSRLAVVVRDGSLRLYAIDDAGLVDVVRNSLTRAFTSTECERYGIEPCPTIDELRAQ
jgi:WD40 repeat protein